MVSTSSSAGWPAASIARRTAAMSEMHAGRGLVVHHADRLDRRSRRSWRRRASIRSGCDAAAPRPRAGRSPGRCPGSAQELGLAGRGAGAIFCQSDAKWPVSTISTASPGLISVDERRLPGAGARCRVDDDRMAGLEDLLHAGDDLLAERAELGPAVVDRRQAHRPQDAVGHRARAGNLQEVAAAGMLVEGEHGSSLRSALSLSCTRGLVKANFLHDRERPAGAGPCIDNRLSMIRP